MSLLTKAAGKLDAAFVGLPADLRTTIGLAAYRAWPALQQYQADLAPAAADKRLAAAAWDIAIAMGWRLMKRGTRALEFTDKELTELRDVAPNLMAAGSRLVALIEGRGFANQNLVTSEVPTRKVIR